MKRLPWIMSVAILLSACAPGSSATPTGLPPTPGPTSPAPSAVPPSPVPTVVPVSLAGPSSGTLVAWVDGSTLVYVPAGEFLMGLGVGDAPQRNVTLDAYWIQQTEVTNQMYALCAVSGSCAAPAQEIGTPLYTTAAYAAYPVVGVTWDLADQYCRWIGGQLPSEAQWEKAARGQNGNVYPWGNDRPTCDLANFGGCLGHASPVTDYPNGKSPYGVLDMAGSVYQWVNDYYGQNYYGNAPASNPPGPATGDHRVIRGSSFESEASLLIAALRHPAPPSYANYDLGFRCVVNQPKAFAPFCQLSSYLPVGNSQTPQAGACQVPTTQVRGNYCQGTNSFATLALPEGTTYQVKSKDFSCSDAVVNGQRLLTCSGPDNSSTDITVCNPACSGAPDTSGAVPVCDPGYNLDAGTHACLYAPVAQQPAVAGCPAGFNMLDQAGQKVCAVGLNQNGQCPAGLYFDTQYGACVSPGQANAPYGIDNPNLAAQTYQGCPAGYSYSPQYQCCQAKTGGSYPGCPLGFTYDASQKTCTPGQVRVSGPGCVTAQLNTLQCGPIVDLCNVYRPEAVCLRNGCHWNDTKNICQTTLP